jgi:hypothetical protein
MRHWWMLLLLAPAGTRAQTEAVRPLEFRRLAELPPRLRETSGVAASRRLPGILWTHNDSGDGPTLYAVDTTGQLRGTFVVTGARAVDWEDVAVGPCPGGSDDARSWCVFIGDIGDNAGRRRGVVVYAVPEPSPHEVPATQIGRTPRARALRVRYRDGPHDAEAIAVDPAGSVSIITKGRDGAVLRYEIPPAAWDRDEVEVVARDTLPIAPQMLAGRWVTGAAVDSAGQLAVVRTYTEIFRFRSGPRWIPVGPACRFGLSEPFGEGVEMLGDDLFVLTNERAPGTPAGLTLVRCP